ncbi:MAG: lysophospholipid acyltransferase family protein [Phycisphaerales bacterium]|nr:1-acyl-sn-glycerol-3-phosphate acyltransferase [Planctomycetota bacterium]
MTPQGLGIILLAVLGLALLARTSAALLRNDREDPMAGLLLFAMRLYARLVQRVRIEGLENIPKGTRVGPLIVVSNHTAGADVPLIQSLARFEVRWVMARSMQVASLQWFWEWARVIGVDTGSRDTLAMREAMRHVQEGGVLGIFPEGGLERPARSIMPFQPGVGLIIKKTGAPVLPILIDGTPQVEPAWASLWRFGNARIRVFPRIDYSKSGLSASEIVADLEKRYLEWSGWPLNPIAARPGRPSHEAAAPPGTDRPGSDLALSA